jgi:hypothetical protein
VTRYRLLDDDPLDPPYKAEPKRMADSAHDHKQMPATPFNFNVAGKGG